jgi:hypothetical protein
MKTEMIEISLTKETSSTDIQKGTTLRKKGPTAMTQKIVIRTDTNKSPALGHLTIVIDHTNNIPKNIETIENVLEAFRE